MESPVCASDTRLIETLGWNGEAFVRLDQHLNRLQTSAKTLGFAYDPQKIALVLATVTGQTPQRIRLTLGQKGDLELTCTPLSAAPTRWVLTLAPERLVSANPLLAHKTTERALYDQTRAALAKGIDEAIFANERSEICEGTITSLFFDLGGGLATPPLRCGCLPGVLRAEMLSTGQCREAILHLSDLRRARLWVGNSLRGLIPAVLTGSD